MATQKGQYDYPVRTVSEVRTVIEPEFQPDLFDEQKLYVDLDAVRDSTYLDKLYFKLGYDVETNTFESSSDYLKIIFSGHRGCGKSAELKRINLTLNKPEHYFVVFIDLEQEVDVGSFQYADFFSLLIHKLIEELTKRKVQKGASNLKKLAERFFQKEELERKGTTKSSSTGEAKVSGGFKFFSWGAEGSFKEMFSGENETSRKIRQEIKQNTLGLIKELNVALIDVRFNIQQKNLGQDILFIIDGSEKVQSEVYENLFVKNGAIMAEINANLLTAVPISAHYLIEKAPFTFPNRFKVPMLKFDEKGKTKACMKAIIAGRIDTSNFVEDDALNECVKYSGGCIRQLFQVLSISFMTALGKKILVQHVQKAVKELGQDLWEYLDTEHLAVLKEQEGNYRAADKKVGELLYALILLKYNGDIKVNPLLEHYPDYQKWRSL